MSIEAKEKVWSVTLNSDCQCYDCKGCGVGYVGAGEDKKCDDCGSEMVYSGSCFGCWDDSEASFYDVLHEWRREVGVSWDLVRIDGSAMGWTRSKGSAVVPLHRALGALTLRGDFRIEVKLEGKSFSARRYSHDEPTGASFYFTLVKGSEE